jgi:hypothetical protein
VTRWPILVLTSLTVLGGTVACVSDPTPRATPRGATKVSADLAQLYDRHRSGRVSPDDRVLIDAVAAGDVNLLKADLERLGIHEAVAFGRMVSGRLPVSAIGALNGLASLQFARMAHATTHPRTPREGGR